MRELILNKIEQNDFLYSILTNPDEFLTDEKHFQFHPIRKSIDETLIQWYEVQYITVEGAQLGELYISSQYVMFKSKCEKVNPSYKFAMKVGDYD